MATVRVARYDMPLSLVWMTSSKLTARTDPEAGTDHILKPHDFEMRQYYNITARARDRSQHTAGHRSHVIIDVNDVNKNLHAPVFSNFIVRVEIVGVSPINTVVMHVTDPDADNPMAIPGDYTLTHTIKDSLHITLCVITFYHLFLWLLVAFLATCRTAAVVVLMQFCMFC